MSSLLGRGFFSTAFEDCEIKGSLDFDAILVSAMLEDAPLCFGLDFMLLSGIECVAGPAVLVACSFCCRSFCVEVALEDEVEMAGTAGLIAALAVILRGGRGGAGGGGCGAAKGGKS